ncbi:MAG TPA: hypothetical protein VK817_15230 [Trebonia sp.]|jgi:hypothetical protein|nr:hypothetical protein [Trebonia sp.]
MASDRGTMTRGAGPDQQPPWAEPTAPAGRRMPSAPRERKPALAILAVLLIVGGALAAGVLVLQSGQHVGAVEITQAVPAGQPIPSSAIQEVQIAKGTSVDYVSWQFAGEISQYLSNEAIPPDTLLNSGMLTKAKSLPSGMAYVGLALKDGEAPTSLQSGDTVSIYPTASSGSGGCPGKPGLALTTGATVVSVKPDATNSGEVDVVVQMEQEEVGQVVCNTANGTTGIAITSGNGAG